MRPIQIRALPDTKTLTVGNLSAAMIPLTIRKLCRNPKRESAARRIFDQQRPTCPKNLQQTLGRDRKEDFDRPGAC